MTRASCALMAALVLAGCQSPGSVDSHGFIAPGFGAHQSLEQRGRAVDDPAVVHAGYNASGDAGVVQAGYNTGHGAMQNRSFSHQRVAQAVPSTGAQLPAAPWLAGMLPPGDGPAMPPPVPPSVPLGPRFGSGRTQIRFVAPTGMKIGWQVSEAGVPDTFSAPQLDVPARYNFFQARIYRLKLTHIVNREGLELYPTLEVYPGNAKIDPYLAHNAVPIEFTDEDFDHIQAGNFVTKVIYLPDPKFQDLAIAGVETLVSTRLDPGVDPVQEAHRRGAILAVVRLGSVDLEMPHSPTLFPQPGLGAMMTENGTPGVQPSHNLAGTAPTK